MGGEPCLGNGRGNVLNVNSRKRKIVLTQDWGNIPEKKRKMQGKDEGKTIFGREGGKLDSSGEEEEIDTEGDTSENDEVGWWIGSKEGETIEGTLVRLEREGIEERAWREIEGEITPGRGRKRARELWDGAGWEGIMIWRGGEEEGRVDIFDKEDLEQLEEIEEERRVEIEEEERKLEEKNKRSMGVLSLIHI